MKRTVASDVSLVVIVAMVGSMHPDEKCRAAPRRCSIAGSGTGRAPRTLSR